MKKVRCEVCMKSKYIRTPIIEIPAHTSAIVKFFINNTVERYNVLDLLKLFFSHYIYNWVINCVFPLEWGIRLSLVFNHSFCVCAIE